MKIPSAGVEFAATKFDCREGISELYEITLDTSIDSSESFAFDAVLGQSATIALGLPDGSDRVLHGIVRSVAGGAANRAQDVLARTPYRFVLVPALWLLTRRTQSRIFQQQSVPDILRTVLTGLTSRFELQGTYEQRDYCVQYRESDFAFASRLMEEEGIRYFFEHADGKHTLVLADTPLSSPTVPGASTIIFEPVLGGLRTEERILAWEKSQTITSGKVTLWDHTFELPRKDLEASDTIVATVAAGAVSHKLQVASNGTLEQYDYPGGYAKRFDGVAPGGGDRTADTSKIFQDNVRTVKLRMQQVQADAITIDGGSNCRQLVSGHKFTLDRHPDGDGEYLLVSVQHQLRMEPDKSGNLQETYANTFTCVPSAVVYRPPRVTERPTVRGCQTAVVVGPAGDEIFVDKYGRVKAQFPWDRDGKHDVNSSCWMRVSSHWAGHQWGAVHLPRIGQEVVVDFLEGDPDRPIITGSVYNADMLPPYTLPDNKTQSGIKSRSTPKGAPDNFNEIRFEDKKDSEHINVQAEKDLMTKVKHDETRTVHNDRTTIIANNDTRTVGGVDKDGTEIGGNDTITVKKGNRTITVDKGNLATTVKEGNETREITQGDQTIDVKQGKQTITIMSDQALTVKTGNRTTTIDTGNDTHTVKTGNIKTEASMGNIDYAVKMGNFTVKASLGKITMEALQAIELKVGASSIKIDQMGVTISGMMIKIEGQVMTQVKAPMTQVNGDAMLMLKGGITMIN